MVKADIKSMNPEDEKLFKQDYYDDTRLGEINVLSDFTNLEIRTSTLVILFQFLFRFLWLS